MISTRSELFRRLEEPQKRGQATEAILTAEFVLRDVPVSIPNYDNDPYDLLIDVDDSFFRIQCKTAYGGPETVQFETVSTRTTSSGYERSSYDGSIDFFAVYDPMSDRCYLVHASEAATGKMEIRLREPMNNQSVGVNWYEEFVFETRIPRLRDHGVETFSV